MSCKRLLLYLSFILSVVVSQEIIEDVSNRLFIEPMEAVTLDVFIDTEYILNISDLEPNTKYMVKLSYPGSIPVQYDIFFEQDNSDEIVSSSIHKRRIQDTRILSFQTDKVGRVYMKDSTTGLIKYYHPILHIIPRHFAIDRAPYNPSERFATIIIEPTVLSMTPTIQIETVVLIGIGIIVLYVLTLYYQNPAFAQWANHFLGFAEKTD